MKTPLTLLTLASLGLVLGACSTASEPTPTTTGGSTPEAVEIPTQDAADAAAAEAITPENADEALDALEAEILGDA